MCTSRWDILYSYVNMSNKSTDALNEKGSKVEVDVAMCPLLSLFCREENRDGDTYVP